MAKMLKIVGITIVIALLCGLVAACGETPSSTETPTQTAPPSETPTPTPTETVGGTGLVSISVRPSSLEVDNRATQTLNVTAYYADGSEKNVTRDCTYETTDRTIATVMTEDMPGEDEFHPTIPGGWVVALDPGRAIITITYSEGGVTKSVELDVLVNYMMP